MGVSDTHRAGRYGGRVPRPTSFAELGVPAAIVEALSASGITQPFAIQAETIPDLVDGRDVIDVISKGAAQSWQMENRFETMIDDQFDFGFAVDWMVKDLDICLDEAKRNGADLPITQIIRDYYGDVQNMGGGRWDTSSLIARLRGKQ